jgi:hypothetical protein
MYIGRSQHADNDANGLFHDFRVYNTALSASDIKDLYDAAFETVVNKAALQVAIAEANTKVEANYTVQSWAAFAAALSSAVSVNADANATQVAVDSAPQALNAAMTALVDAPPPSQGRIHR